MLVKKKTDRFFAISEMGDKYLIFEYTDLPEVNHSDGRIKKNIPGRKRYLTSEGMAVFPIADDIYTIAQLEIDVRRQTR